MYYTSADDDDEEGDDDDDDVAMSMMLVMVLLPFAVAVVLLLSALYLPHSQRITTILFGVWRKLYFLLGQNYTQYIRESIKAFLVLYVFEFRYFNV